MKTDAGIKGMLSEAKEFQEPPETGRGKKRFPPRVFFGGDVCANTSISEFWTPES